MFSAEPVCAILRLLALSSQTLFGNFFVAKNPGLNERADVVQVKEDGLQIIVRDKGAHRFAMFGNDYNIDEVITWWIFSDMVPAEHRELMEITLAVQIEQTCKAYHLSEQYRQKLYLAGHADIQRFFERVNDFNVQFRRLIEAAAKIEDEEPRTAERLRKLCIQLPFRQSDSMYQKVLLRTLTSERLVPLPLDLLDRRASVTAFEKLNYHESLAEFVAQALASEAPLRDKRQRIQLAAMIKRELRPIQIISPKNSVFTWRKLSELPESAWKSRLDQAQWEALNRKFQEFQGTTETK